MTAFLSAELAGIVLPGIDGREIELGSLWVASLAILVFLRHYARRFREDSGITFPLLVNEKRETYRVAGLRSGNLLHILRSENKAARKLARVTDHRQGRAGENPFQLSGSFVFGLGNVDHFTHLTETSGNSASLAALPAALPG